MEVIHHFARCRADDANETLPEMYETAEDETLPEIHEMPEVYETAEDEMSPEMHDISDRGFEEAANLMLTLCQQNEMEKHRKSREIQRHIETETRRAIWYIVEDGILGACYDFWDEDEEDEDGTPIIRVEEHEWLEIIQHLLTQDVRVREW